MVLCAAAALLLLALLGRDLCRTQENTFSVFYFAAAAVSKGGNLYASHPPGGRCEYVYPPLFAALLTPLTALRLGAARRIWTLLDAALTLVAAGACAREAARRFRVPACPAAAIAAAGLLLGMGEIKTELSTSQTDTLVLTAFVMALVWLDRFPMLAGAALGFGCNIKYQTLITLPYLLATRRWRAAASASASAVGFALLPALLVGFRKNCVYLGSAFGGLGRFAGLHATHAAATVPLTWIRSVSITSALGRLLEHFGFCPGRAIPLAFAAAIACLLGMRAIYRLHGFTMLRGPRRGADALAMIEWTGLMAAWLAFGPEVSRRHMYVLLLMHVVAVALLLVSRGRPRVLLFAGLLLCQAALRLPSGHGLAASARGFNWIGGPSVCMLLFYAAILNAGLAWLRSRGPGLRSAPALAPPAIPAPAYVPVAPGLTHAGA